MRTDFGSKFRVVQLASGRKALLCACYDMFGAAERGNVNGKRARAIGSVGEFESWIARGDNGFSDRLNSNLATFKALLIDPDLTVGIAAIHEFGMATFWQRHGIASCAASLGNTGIAIGAAHFDPLPSRADASPLAAKNVPRRHLELLDFRARGAHRLRPLDSFTLQLGSNRTLVRLFH